MINKPKIIDICFIYTLYINSKYIHQSFSFLYGSLLGLIKKKTRNNELVFHNNELVFLIKS